MENYDDAYAFVTMLLLNAEDAEIMQELIMAALEMWKENLEIMIYGEVRDV